MPIIIINMYLRKMPKVELHVHLDGSVNLDLIKSLSGDNSDNIIESSNCYASNLFYTKDIFEIIGVKGRHTVKTWYGDIILYTKVGTYS